MVNPINFPGPLPPVDPLHSAQQPGETAPTEGKGFKSILLDSLNEVNKLQLLRHWGVPANHRLASGHRSLRSSPRSISREKKLDPTNPSVRRARVKE
jgi:hypothetical protein